MEYRNYLNLKFLSISENEGFARLAIASFCSLRDVDVEQIADIKTAVSEAVTNCVVHAYPENVGEIEIVCEILDNEITISIIDQGIGINNIELAKKPFYTSKPNEDRSGMGFTVMEGFMDSLSVESQKNKGVKVTMTKKLGDYSIAVGG